VDPDDWSAPHVFGFSYVVTSLLTDYGFRGRAYWPQGAGPPPPFGGLDPYFGGDHPGGGPYGPGRGGPGPGGPPPGRRGDRGERRRRDEGPPGVSLLVRNISPDATQQDLQIAFGRIGEVRDVYIPRDFHSNQPKGFAFIEYATPEMAREAREEMDRFLIKGRMLEVVFAQERRKTPNEMRGRVVNQQNRGRGPSFERRVLFHYSGFRAQLDPTNVSFSLTFVRFLIQIVIL
jgi:hypothetical protein